MLNRHIRILMFMLFGMGLGPVGKLVSGARIKRYPKNQMLLYGGDSISDLYVLRKGVAKMYDIDTKGNEKILHLLKPPGILPLTSFGKSGQMNEWFYGAITDCEVYSVSYSEAERRIAADGKLAAYLMHQSASEMHELLKRISSLGKSNSQGKLAQALTFLAVLHASECHGGWRRVSFPVGHQLLADMIGMTRESTALGLKRLREHNIIRYPHATQLEIHFDHLVAASAS